MSTNIVIASKPEARCAISIRAATAADIPFIDGLQKMHSHMVGWFPTKQLEKYINDECVVVAEESGFSVNGSRSSVHETSTRTPTTEDRRLLGYCIFRDQYLKRDDVGIIYQLNVLPLKQRNLIGASLIKAVFERAAYGCKLYSCWCAQDIQANWFWESIGFVPLAFRTGSRAKQRTHIFWQRRIRENDDATPYWFPFETNAGAIGEDRIVLPIPPGTHWRDAKPLILPDLPVLDHRRDACATEGPKTLPGGALVKPRGEQSPEKRVSKAHAAAIARSKSKHLGGAPAGKVAMITAGGVRYLDRADAPSIEQEQSTKPKKPKSQRPRAKNDPKYVKAARELLATGTWNK